MKFGMSRMSCGVVCCADLHTAGSHQRAVEQFLLHLTENGNLVFMADKGDFEGAPDYLARKRVGFIIYSDAVNQGYGRNLTKYITENKLGGVTVSHMTRNPNSGNNIEVFVYTPNDAALLKWRKAYNAKKAAEKENMAAAQKPISMNEVPFAPTAVETSLDVAISSRISAADIRLGRSSLPDARPRQVPMYTPDREQTDLLNTMEEMADAPREPLDPSRRR